MSILESCHPKLTDLLTTLSKLWIRILLFYSTNQRIIKAITMGHFFLEFKEPSLTNVYKIYINDRKLNFEEIRIFPPKNALSAFSKVQKWT